MQRPPNTRKIGGGGGGKFIDVGPKAILIGTMFGRALGGHLDPRGVRQSCQNAHGRVHGKRHGVGEGSPVRVEAKEGYAVAAIEARVEIG